MWHGLGLHPYFPRYPETQLQVAAQNVWLGEDGQLPSRQVPIPAPWRFHELRGLPVEAVDHAFSGWAGDCIIEQPGYRLHCRASDTDHFLLFCPQGQSFFCFEPVSHPINAHHLPGRPGLRLLHREESTRLRFSLQYQSSC
jgi:aldose 1-epimerase